MDGDSDWRTAFKRFAAGAAGGGIDSLFTMPFDTMKTQMQLNREMRASIFRCGRQIFVTDGIPGFYKGYVPFAVMAMGKASVRWGTFGVFCKAVDGLGFDRTQNKIFWTATCGIGAGCCEALCWTAPNERLKVLRQVSAGTGTRTVPYREIFARDGLVRYLWVGATPTVLRSASNAGIRFSIAGHVKGVFRWLTGTPDKDALPFYANFLAGGTGGAISVVMNNPVDVVKSKMQSGHTSGLLSTFRSIYAEQGLIGFGAGITARVPQIFLSQAIQFMVIEKLMAG